MRYTDNSKLGDILSDHYQLLLVMSRFGIPLGFGDASIGEVCEHAGVDCPTFLAVVNYVANGDNTGAKDVSVREMTSFLKKSHRYYLDFFFPELRRKLIDAIDFGQDDKLSTLILCFFDDYVSEVRKHLNYEDDNLFCYAEQLCNVSTEELKHITPVNIVRYSRQHEQIDSKILELKSIMIKYYPDHGRVNQLNSVLYDIFSCEEDFKSHCDIEDNIFVPAVVELEQKRRNEQ